jgi:hypothetical protein
MRSGQALEVGRRLLAAMGLALAAAAPALAMEQGGYSMVVLVDGVAVAEYAARGRTYLEAIEGRDYSIRLRNGTGGRVAVALSVDGLNSIDAATTASRDASKWILGPYQSITIDGWQTGPSTARRFFFTTEDRSYGAWLGKTRNLGVIAAVFYRERVVETPAPIWRDGGEREKSHPPAGSPEGSRSSPRRDARPRSEGAAAEPLGLDDSAATGIGEEVGHRVRRVEFDAEPSPAAVLQVRYEYQDALVRLGVLPRPHGPCEAPLWRRERARGFEDMGFAPDPYRRDCE